MGEERFIDENKDKKYKIRINEDGEEELVIDESEDEDAPVFDMPDYEFDDEEAAELTPEQLKEREEKKAEEEKAKNEKLNSLLIEAKEKLEKSDFTGANGVLIQAEEVDNTCGEVYCLKLKALSKNMTEFSNLESLADASDKVKAYATEEQKKELLENSEKLKALLDEAEAKTKALSSENEEKKGERRSVFKKRFIKSAVALFCTLVPLIVFFILAITYAKRIIEGEMDENMVSTIVFAALTVVSFIATVFTVKGFWSATRDVILNERDGSTKLGREYLESKTRLDYLKRIYDIL